MVGSGLVDGVGNAEAGEAASLVGADPGGAVAAADGIMANSSMSPILTNRWYRLSRNSIKSALNASGTGSPEGGP